MIPVLILARGFKLKVITLLLKMCFFLKWTNLLSLTLIRWLKLAEKEKVIKNMIIPHLTTMTRSLEK